MVCCPSPKSYRINLSLFPIAKTRTFSSSLCILFSFWFHWIFTSARKSSLTLTIGLISCHSSNSWKFLLNYVQLGRTQHVSFQPSEVGGDVYVHLITAKGHVLQCIANWTPLDGNLNQGLPALCSPQVPLSASLDVSPWCSAKTSASSHPKLSFQPAFPPIAPFLVCSHISCPGTLAQYPWLIPTDTHTILQ